MPMDPVEMQHAVKMMGATRCNAASTLAAGIIAAASRPVSLDEAMKIHTDVYLSLFPEPGNGMYDHWKKTHDGTKPYT